LSEWDEGERESTGCSGGRGGVADAWGPRGVRGAKFLRVGHARMCTGGPSAGGARTVRGADVARLDLVVVD